MLEIAGGIFVGFLVIAFLPYIFDSAIWLLAIGVCLAFAAVAWFGLTLLFGPNWASLICAVAFAFWFIPNRRHALGSKPGAPDTEANDRAFKVGIHWPALFRFLLKLSGALVAMCVAMVVAVLMALLLGDVGLVLGIMICGAAPFGLAVLWYRDQKSISQERAKRAK